MFLAIVNDTYAEVKYAELKDKSYLWRYLAKICCRCCKKEESSQGDLDHTGSRRTKERKTFETRVEDQQRAMDNLFKVVEQRDSIEFDKLAKRVAFVEGSMQKLHERLDILIVKLKRKAEKHIK